jgi:hypothetical protein
MITRKEAYAAGDERLMPVHRLCIAATLVILRFHFRIEWAVLFRNDTAIGENFLKCRQLCQVIKE